jgi:hypothetical protein
LTRSAGIKLNNRDLLQRTLETLIIIAVMQDWLTPHVPAIPRD